jgi:hypothetical protein
MKTMWQKILLQTVLLGCILLSGGAPVCAEAASQPSSRIDAYSLAVEDGEYLYLVGDAINPSDQLPAGSLDLAGGMLDMWVAKLRPDGSPVFQALIGGKADDAAHAVVVRQGVIYILGETWSTDFPGAPGNAGENDAVVLALAADGSQILWARRFGGSDQDAGRAIALLENNLYLTGITWSQDFIPGSAKGDADGFLARLDLSGNLAWNIQFGGLGLDAPFGLAAGPGGIWVTGETFSADLAGTPFGGGDIFALRFDANGARQFAGLYGGAGEDVSYAAGLAPDGNLYLAGDTQSAGLPGANGRFGGGTDGFLMHIKPDGSILSSNYLGGSGLDTGMALTVLPNGDALVAGGTYSPQFPTGYTLSAASKGDQDAFLAQINPAGELVSVSLQGGSGDDAARGVGITANAIALAGRFSVGGLPYLLLVPSADLGDATLPTNAPPLPTATLALTATARPTETPGPTRTATPTPVNTPTAEISPTPPLPAGVTPAEIQPGGTSIAFAPGSSDTPAAPPIQTLPANAASTPQVVPDRSLIPLGVWVAVGLILIAALGVGIFWYLRK